MLVGSGNNKGAILGAFVIWGVWSGTGFVTDAMQASLSSIAPEIASRTAFLRWTFVGLLLAGIVLYRPEGILKEEKIVSGFLTRFGTGSKKKLATETAKQERGLAVSRRPFWRSEEQQSELTLLMR